MNLFEKAVLTKETKPLCLCCNKPFSPDKRNLNRGWGMFCSKSCSVKYRNKVGRMSKSDQLVESREKKIRQLGL